jgi:repressor LexA
MKALTQKQDQILQFIQSFTEDQGYPPTVREIGYHFKIRSSSVFDHMEALKQKGYLEKERSKPRALRIRGNRGKQIKPINIQEEDWVSVPVVGRVAAGLPTLAIENVEDHIPLPKRMARWDRSFLLKVKGDSMTGSGILNGDHVLVKPQASADNGDIVVAQIEDEATVKKLEITPKRIRLLPTNPAYSPISVKPHTVILGKVVGLIRGC